MKARTRAWFALIVLAVTALVLIALWPRPARAAGPWYVAPGGSDSNSCLSAGSPCATINGAIGKATSGDTIYVATGTYTASTGSEVVLINKNITLSGGWNSGFTTQSGMATIDGEGVRRGVVTSNNSVTTTLENLIIQNGFGDSPGGGGILNNGGALTLISSTVLSNTSPYPAGGIGGGIFNAGAVTIISSTLSNNSASFGGGAIFNLEGTITLTQATITGNTASDPCCSGGGGGSGVENRGTLVISNSTINNNGTLDLAGGTRGGGIYNAGAATIISSTLGNNSAPYDGGAIFNSGTLTLTQANITGNTIGNLCCSGFGGGGGIENVGTLVISNSTISNNRILGGFDGIAINNIDGTLILDNSTISGNSGTAVSVDNFYGTVSLNSSTVSNNSNGIRNRAGSVTLRNSIVAGNNGADCVNDTGYGGAVTSLGYNLIQSNSNCTLIASDLTGDPRLGPLQNNGGSTPTHALLFGSPATDAGNPAGCTDNLGNPLNADQRGVPRARRCDIGAYEYDGPFFQAFLPLLTRDFCSPFSDNFSNPASGWPVADDGQVRWEYLSGEYRILVRPTDTWAGARPGVKCSDYTVAVDVRNATGGDGTYGLIFGLSDDWEQFYTFEIAPDGYYYLWRYDGGNWTLLLSGYSPSINTGTSTNRIKIERVGAQIKAYANNQLLINTSDGAYTGVRHVGLIVTSYSQPNVDGRFDNFVVCAPGCSAAATLSGAGVTSQGMANPTILSSADAMSSGASGSKDTEPFVPAPHPDAVPTERDVWRSDDQAKPN